MLYRTFGAERMIIISDEISAAGLSDGVYESGGLRVTVKDTAKVADLAAWKAEGALSLLIKDGGIQAVYGPKADVLKSDINDIL